MLTAGTPSSDPWVIQPRERARYLEQFQSLQPINGIVTGKQAKDFLLQSQLPPQVLGQIWSLADTDADGKMDINEFSIACKLINLKLRGFEIPNVVPPTLLASLKMQPTPVVPPAIPPLPNVSLINAPARPEPPKPTPPIIPPQPQPLIPNIPTGIVPPMPSTVGQPAGMIPRPGFPAPIIPGGPIPPAVPPSVAPLIGGMPPLSTAQLIGATTLPTAVLAPMTTTAPIPAAPVVPIPPTGVIPSTGVVPPTGVIPTSGILPGIPPVSVPASVGGILGGVVPPTAVPAVVPGASSTPRGSVTSLERVASVDSPQLEWAVPHQTKLKYTQIFNTTDRTRTGYLSGAQARNVMVESKLPQPVLAKIWALSDMDADGRLGCEEFVLAMHLCEQALAGVPPPAALPPDLIPPSFRRGARTASISSQGSVHQLDQDPASTLLQTSFEDKRKENFEKGQAELERRRKTLLDQQRKEKEEQERKEREEQERKEKARQEAERKRLEELEKQMREQQEQERLKEEERKRQAEQKEAARREMERQRQLEWEKQRLQELQQQRQKEQENVLKLKAKNQSLTIELSTLNEQVKELSQKICDTRVGVSNVKSTIDGMRSTRDAKIQEQSQLKNKLKEQNAKLLALTQEKAKMEAKNKLNAQSSQQDKQAYDNKEITIKNLREKIEDMQKEIDSKMSDIENNNSQLTDLRTQLVTMVHECENLYKTYEKKRDKVMEMKNSNKSVDFNAGWKDTGGWGDTTTENQEWPVDNWETKAPEDVSSLPGIVKYRALYEFVARNPDELSFQPGDIINVPIEQKGEPGWLAGEIRGHTGWFPESYVESIDGTTVTHTALTSSEEAAESKRLEGIAEVPETLEPVVQVVEVQPESEVEYYIANYTYQSQEQGDLCFNAGDMITVVKKDGDWWTGKIGGLVGIFPSNYVQKVEVTNTAPVNQTASPVSVATSVEQQESANAASQVDNEVSQITEKQEKIDFAAMGANTQTLKGKKPEIASVIAPYQATSPEQLSLARGQLIMIRKKTDSGWWEGELQAKGRKRQVGWFPASYVKVLNSSGRGSGRTTPVSTTRIQQEVVIDKVIALFPYTAANPDELSFLKDDIISVTARDEDAWWKGELNGVSGLFPSNYVKPLQTQSSSNKYEDKVRRDAINELIQTEKTYIEDMAIVHKVFEKPLRDSRAISQKDVEGIFVNWQDILQCNKNFLTDLLDRRESGSDIIGDVICSHLPRMTSYITFCSRQLDSAALLQRLTETSPAFRDVVRRCQNNVATRGMPLSSFLIKPMQRITKYPLLISKILDNTPENHTDRVYLKEALQTADRFLKLINENVRIKENEDRLEWLQNHVQTDFNIVFNSTTNKLGQRKLLHFGNLTKVKSGRELIGFLFNDFFMLVQINKSISSGQFSFQRNSNIIYKAYRQPILIQDLQATKGSTDNVETGTDANRVLKIQDKNKQTIALLTQSVSDCNSWLKHIDSAKEVHSKVSQLTKIRPKSKAPAGVVGRLLVLVQKGKRFINSGKAHCENVYCKVSLGEQEQQTDMAKDNMTSNGNIAHNGPPQIPTLIWNYSMQFHVRNISEDVLQLVVYEMCPFTPDEFLGRAELKLQDIYSESQNVNGPLTKKLILHQVESGEVVVKLDLQMFSNSYY